MLRLRDFLLTGALVTPVSSCGGGPGVTGSIESGDAGGDEVSPTLKIFPGLRESAVVCRTCAPELLDAKREGILSAMGLLEQMAGADILPAHAPITFHLDDDEVCGTAADMLQQNGFVTGFEGLDDDGKSHVCLFDVEKTNRTLPFTPENARTLLDQVLPLHEAMHAWFTGREDDTELQQPFAEMTALTLSGTISDPCVTYRVTDAPDRLIPELCDLGFVVRDDLPVVLRRTATQAASESRALTNTEFAGIVSAVMGADASFAFVDAGLLTSTGIQ